MRRRNSLKNDSSFCRIHICVNPVGPGCQTFAKSNHPIHVLDNLVLIFNIVPSAIFQKIKPSHNKPTFCRMMLFSYKYRAHTYGCLGPLRYHQSQVLKTRTSISFHRAPFFRESSFRTRPTCSSSMSTK